MRIKHDFYKLDEFLYKNTNNAKIPGASCIIHYKGEMIYLRSTGYSDIDTKKEMTEDTLLNQYSLTKVITCIAALQLYENGMYLLNDPLYVYMPEFKEMTVKQIIEGKEEIIPCNNHIRIKDLFTMTAGFDYNFNSSAVMRAKQKTDGAVQLQAFIKELVKESLIFEPGERWAYSFCHDVLAAFIEVISGIKFSEYIEKNIFKPLGIANAGFHMESLNVENIGTLYEYNVKTECVQKVNNKNFCKLGSEYESGGGGIISSANDYSKITAALANKGLGLNGERILCSSTIDLMRSNHLNEKCLKSYDWRELEGYGYGLGVRTMIDLVKAGSNGSLGEFGWNGAGGSYMLADPQKNLAVTYTEHVLNGAVASGRIHTNLRNVIYSCLDD